MPTRKIYKPRRAVLRQAQVEVVAPLDPHLTGPSGRATPVRTVASPDPSQVIRYTLEYVDAVSALMLLEKFNLTRAAAAVDKALLELSRLSPAVPGKYEPSVVIPGSGGLHQYHLRRDGVFPHKLNLSFDALHITGARSFQMLADLEALGIEVF